MSLIQNTYKDSISEVFECFKNTEKIIKKFEKTHGELPIPSVNELRYVGYHFLMATTETSDVSIRENIEKALNHCKRAKFDTYEASSMILLEELKIFNESYGKIVETQSVITDYVGKLSKIEEIKNSLEEIVSGDYESREVYYQEIKPKHEDLKMILKEFKLSEPQIDILVEENNSTKKTASRRFVTTVILGLFGTVVLLTARLGWSDSKDSQKPFLDKNESNITKPSTPSPKQSEK